MEKGERIIMKMNRRLRPVVVELKWITTTTTEVNKS
jgi:hypothetical protein